MSSASRRGAARSIADLATMLAQTRLLAGLFPIARAVRGEGATVSAAVSAGAARFGSAVALTDAAGSLTYRELDAEASRVASSLRVGDRIGIMCGNSRSFVVALAAVSRAGADAVLLGPGLGALDQATVVERQAIAVVLGEDLRVAPEHPEHPEQDRARRRGRIILLSSGTTGTPEPSERESLALDQVLTAASLIAATGIKPRHPVLLLAPLHHGHGLSLAIACLAIGAPLVLAGGMRMGATLDLAQSAGARVVSGVPAQLLRVAEVQEQHPRELAISRIVSGSARLPSSLVARLVAHFGPVVVDFYGSTQTGTVTISRGADLASGSVGRPAAGVTVRVVDATGQPVPRGSEGFVVAASPLAASRGTQRTGDRGYLDEAGRLFLTARADSLTVTGGENVSVHQVEDYLLAQPEIVDAHVFTVHDERLDAVLAARVVLRSPLTVDALVARVTRDLGRPKTPRILHIVDVIDRTPTGKARS